MKKRLLSLLLVLVLAFSVLSFTSCQFFDKDCDHEWGQWVTMESPTIDKEGRAERTCLKCGEKESKTIAKINHTHTFGEWVVVKEATADEDGIRERTCTYEGCNEKETQTFSLSSLTGNDGITAFKTPAVSTTFEAAVAARLGSAYAGKPAYRIEQYSNNTVIISGEIANYGTDPDPDNKVSLLLTYLGVYSASDAVVTVLDETTNRYIDNDNFKIIDSLDEYYLNISNLDYKQYQIQIKWTDSKNNTKTGKYTLDFTNALLCKLDNFIGAFAITINNDTEHPAGQVTSSIISDANINKFTYEGVFLGENDYAMSDEYYYVTQYNKTFVIDGTIPYIDRTDVDSSYNKDFGGNNYVVGILFKVASNETSITASKDRKLSVSNSSTAKVLTNIDVLKLTDNYDADSSIDQPHYFMVYWKVDPSNTTRTVTITVDINPEAYVPQTYTIKLADTVTWENHDDGYVSFTGEDIGISVKLVDTVTVDPDGSQNYGIITRAKGEGNDEDDNINGTVSQIGNTIYVNGGSYSYFYKKDGTAVGWVVPMTFVASSSTDYDIVGLSGNVYVPNQADHTAAGLSGEIGDYTYNHAFVVLNSNAKNQSRTITVRLERSAGNTVSKSYNIEFTNINCLGYIDNFASFDKASGTDITLQQYGTNIIVSGTIELAAKDEFDNIFKTNPKGNYIQLVIKQESVKPLYNASTAKVVVSGCGVESFNTTFKATTEDENLFSGTASLGGTLRIALPVVSESDKIKLKITWGTDAEAKVQSVTYTISFDNITLEKE